MKIFVSTVFFIAMALISFKPAYAVGVKGEESTSSVSVNKQVEITERKKMLSELKQQVKTGIDEKKASISAKLTERKKLTVTNYWTRLVERLNASIDRLDILIQRIESRLSTIEKNNPQEDTSAVRDQLSDAKAKLVAAKTKLSALEDVVGEAIESESPKEAFVVVRNSIKEIKNMLVEVHKILVHVIGDIKGLKVGQEDLNGLTATPTVKPTATATPTPSVTPTVTPTLTSTPTVTPTPTI